MSTDPLFMRDQSGEYFWYHNDHLGTPQMMTTSSGAVVWKAKYSSFGKADVDSGSTVVNPLRFPGQYEDAETGMHYNYHRYYDPVIGRYLKKDPIGFWGGINLHTYVFNNPSNNYDPYGQFTLSQLVTVVVLSAITVTYAVWLMDQTQKQLNQRKYDYPDPPTPSPETYEHSMESPNDHSPWSPNPAVNEEFVRDRDKVKEYDIKPPPYQNPKKPKCDEIRERIKHFQRAITERVNFTNKWYDGQCNLGHAGRIRTLEKERDRLQRRLDRGDCQ